MWSPWWMISVAVRSWWSSFGTYLDCLLWCHSIDYSVRSVVIFNLARWLYTVVILQLFGISFGTVSVVVFAFIRTMVWNALVVILHSFGMDQAHWTYHLSPVHLRVYSASVICSAHFSLWSWGVLACSSPGVVVDSSVGVVANNWLGALIVYLWVQ